MKITPRGVDLIKSYEKCRLSAYPDPATGKAPWTIGWGHTGSAVGPGTTWTQQEADDMFTKDVIETCRLVDRHLKCRITPNQYSAVVSLVYNIGIGNFVGHDLLKYLNAGDLKAAAAEFPKWNKANGKVMAGLTKRRLEEQKLFLS